MQWIFLHRKYKSEDFSALANLLFFRHPLISVSSHYFLLSYMEELSSSITNHTVVGQGRIIKAFPKMQHRDYSELIQELKKRLK